MGKLFDLNEWLTPPAAARHLASRFKEDVNEAAVLRLALDGRLRLSVYFVNHAEAVRGHIVPIADAYYEDLPLPDDSETVRVYKGPVLYTHGEKSHVLELEDEILTLKGIFDLPMIGNEQLDIEHDYHCLTGGPRVTRGSMDGTFVEGKDGVIYQLQEHIEDNSFVRGSRAHLKDVRCRIGSGNIDTLQIEALLKRYQEDRQKLLEKKRSQHELDSYFPAGNLPKDRVLVVRSEALRQFEQASGIAAANEKPAQREERLKKRVGEERAKGAKAFLETVAQEERISVSRLKQIIYKEPKPKIESSRWADLRTSKR